MRVRVLIATTEGPVGVDRIVSSPLRKSIVCAWNGKEHLPSISASYDAFVRRRLGQTAQQRAHQAFRLDIECRIDSGESWQLPILIAHGLHDAGRLVGREEAEHAGTIVLATGKIEHGLTVGAVGHVEDKLRASLDAIEAARASGKRVIVVLPSGNASDGKAEQDWLRQRDLEPMLVADARQIFARLELLDPAWTSDVVESWEGSPFRGLRVFEKHHRQIFFGRGKAREEALRQLRQQAVKGCAFLLIHGSSGVGKSSLARSGLLGDIEQMSTATEKWRTGVLVPGRAHVSPVAALVETLLTSLPALKLNQSGSEYELRKNPDKWVRSVVSVLERGQAGGRSRLVLLVDQIEELLLWARERHSHDAAAELELFASILGELARTGTVWVIATLRSDLLPLLDDSPSLSALATNQRMYRLERPSRSALHEIIKCPAELAGLSFAGNDTDGLGFVDVLVEAGATSPDSLPLLQFVLERLYEREGRTGTIHYETYQRIGELTHAIGEWAEATVVALGDDIDMGRAVNDVVLELGRPDGESGTIVGRTAVLNDSFLTAARGQVIDALAHARLLVLDIVSGLRTARVAHEALLTHWPRAQALFASCRLALVARERLSRDAREWQDGDRDPSYLIPPGARLATAEQILSEGRIHVSAEVKDFIAASIDKAARERDIELERRERELAERRGRSDRERMRLAADQQKVEHALRLSDYAQAVAVLDEMVAFLSQSDTGLATELPGVDACRSRIRRLTSFFASVKEAFAFAGEEDFKGAHEACAHALAELGIFEHRRWWEHIPTQDLDSDQSARIGEEAYRILLLYSALQLVPGIVALFPGTTGAPPRRLAKFDPAQLLRFVPHSVLAAIVRSRRIGTLQLLRRRDRPEALVHFEKSAAALALAREFEEAALGDNLSTGKARQSRISLIVGGLIEMLKELAAGPVGATVDHRTWFGNAHPGAIPVPANAADHFFVGLFNYFIAKRSDARLAKVIGLLGERFPEIDVHSPLATAERLLRAGIALEPHNYWLHWVLGRVLLTRGDNCSAELAFNTAISLEPRYARGYEQRALALAHQWASCGEIGLFQRALADAAMALEAADGDPSTYWPRGELLEALGETRKALDAYSRWLQLEEDLIGKISRGNGIARLHDLADRVLRTASAAHVEGRALTADAYALMALTHVTWGTYDKSLLNADLALRIDSQHGHALAARGVALAAKGEFAEALSALDLALAVDRSSHFAALVRARTLERLSCDETALVAWRMLGSSSPPWMRREAEIAEQRILRSLQPTHTSSI